MKYMMKTNFGIGGGRGALFMICLALGIALVATGLDAKQMRESEVRAAVETWVRTMTPDARPDAIVGTMEPYIVDGETVAYIARLAGGGFCLCGLDDILLPVYFYSPEGSYDPENSGLQCILSQMTERAQMVRKWARENDPKLQELQQAAAERPKLWGELMDGRAPQRPEEAPMGTTAEPSMMALDLSSVWSQGHPYNGQCPIHPDGAGNHTIVGCPGTAFAQVAYYWKWPNTGSGTSGVYYKTRHRSVGDWDSAPLAADPELTDSPGWSWSGRLKWISSGGGYLQMSGYWDWSIEATAEKDSGLVQNITPAYLTALSTLYGRMPRDSTWYQVNYSTATYDWSIIQDQHIDPSDPGDVEAAKLNYHVAVAVNTNFGLRASSSSCPAIVEGAPAHLRYDGDAVNSSTNITAMTDEIAWLRPLTIGGCGHAWVVLGYDKSTDPDRSFKVNMGWGGSGNGWELLDFYCPASSMEHATRLAPKDVMKFVGSTGAGDGSPGDPYLNVEAAVSAAPANSTLIFKAGSDNTFAASTLIINKALTLKGRNITIRKQ